MAQPLHSLDLGPTATPTLRCKKCKVPLPDATRKNCERCRRIRTENYNRWKRTAEARKNQAKSPISIAIPETHPSSAPPSNVQITRINPAQPPHGASTPLQLTDTITSTSSISLDADLKRGYYRPHTVLSAPQSMSSLLRNIDIPEYQWSEELVNALMALPPRSNFVGQFSVIADPDVDNSKRAQMFLDQLRSKGLPTSETHRPVSVNPGALRGHAIGLNCRCEGGCQGRFVVSVDDDTTHLQGVLGQRIGVALLHTSR